MAHAQRKRVAANLHVGTMGWSSDFWKGNFYLESLTAKEFLGYYARQFDTVEVESTFCRIPRAQIVTEWKMQTPQGFLFSLKFPQVITHVKMLKDCQEETKVFLDILDADWHCSLARINTVDYEAVLLGENNTRRHHSCKTGIDEGNSLAHRWAIANKLISRL